MVRTKYKRPTATTKLRGRSKTQPDQSMSIRQVVERFLRNVPVSGKSYQGYYIDQENVDLERLSRMDGADKAFQASEMRANNEYLQGLINEANERKLAEKEQSDKARKKASDASTGIDDLDNTMPVDTKLSNKELAAQGSKKAKRSQDLEQ